MRPEPVEGPEEGRTGSTRIDELQLSAEPVERSAMGPEPTEGPDAGGFDQTQPGWSRIGSRSGEPRLGLA